MKTATVFGQKLTFKERDYKSLLKRFDTNTFTEKPLGFYYSRVSCALCKHYGCDECPISELDYTCADLVRKISIRKRESERYRLLNLHYYTPLGKKQLDRVHKFLLEKFK